MMLLFTLVKVIFLLQGDCTDCTAGYYCAETGLTTPSGECSAGYICVLGAYSSTPTDYSTGRPCDPGKFCLNGSYEGRFLIYCVVRSVCG